MLKFERILCPVDFSDYSTRALDYAYLLAKHYGSKLFFEHVVQPLTAAYPYYAFPDAVNQIYWNLGADAAVCGRARARAFAPDTFRYGQGKWPNSDR